MAEGLMLMDWVRRVSPNPLVKTEGGQIRGIIVKRDNTIRFAVEDEHGFVWIYRADEIEKVVHDRPATSPDQGG